VNQLGELMLEEFRRRKFAVTTIRTYMHGVAHFSCYFRRSSEPSRTRRLENSHQPAEPESKEKRRRS